MNRRRKQKQHKRMRSGAKWVAAVLAVLLAGVLTEAVRLAEMDGTVGVTAPFQPQYSANDNPQSSIDLAASLCGMDVFRAQYGTSGAGQRIALIDSGVDLSHPALGCNTDGTRKVAVYRDYTEEGVVYTEEVQQKGTQVSLGGTLYEIGAIYNAADSFYMGFLDTTSLQPQLVDGVYGQIAVLVTAVGDRYDCVYVDSNRNCNFTDEVPLYTYGAGGRHIVLQYGAYPVNVAVSEIDVDGGRVQFSADTLGHGTFLAGMIAANGVQYRALAPDAQLYVYKIFNAEGSSSQQKLARAIGQAVEDGVDCINLSLSIPQNEPVLPALSAALEAAAKADIPVIAAVGNYGPGMNTVAYPAREPSVIAVGSCAYPQQYLLDCAVLLEQSFIPEYSGRGSGTGAAAPFVTAPAGVISTLPGWYKEPYLYDYGTSISAAIVTAAVSHLQEATARHATLYPNGISVRQVQAFLADWAQDLGFPAREQGYGALVMGQIVGPASLPVLTSRHDKEPMVYRFPEADTDSELFRPFDIMQGQSQSWQVLVPDDVQVLELSLLLDTQQPDTVFDKPVAMGRCRMYVYSPDGVQVEATEYIGASYGREVESNHAVSIRRPATGVWEIVITSADNLSLYHHFSSTGMLYMKIK